MTTRGRRLRWLSTVVPVLSLVALNAPAAEAQAIPAPSQAGDSTGNAAQDPGAVAIYRVHVAGQADVDRLTTGGYDLVESRGSDYLRVVGSATVAAALRARGFQVDVEQVLSPSASSSEPPTRTTGRNGPFGIGPSITATAEATFDGGYRTVAAHEAHLWSVAAAHPELATVVDYGDSWRKVHGRAGGHDLLAICLTHRQPGDCALTPKAAKPRTVIMAAIHARELQTSEVAYRLIDDLTSGYGTDADLTMLMDTTEIWVIPVVNPDGRDIVESGGDSPFLQRKNADDSHGPCLFPPTAYSHIGVDLNRNADYHWGGLGTTVDPCAQTYRGPMAASEPEQQGLQQLFSRLFADQKGPNLGDPVPTTATGTLVTLHSYGELVLLPPGDRGATPNDSQLRTLAFRLSHFNGYTTGTGPEILYGTTGSTDDWIYGRLGVAGVTFEMSPSDGRCSGFDPPYRCIDDSVYPLNREALLYAVRVASAPYATPLGPTTTTVELPAAVEADASFTVAATVDDDALGNGAGSVGRPPATAVTAAEYRLDALPGSDQPRPEGTAPTDPTAMAATDGSFSAPTEEATATVSTVGLSLGRHTLYIRGRNAGGDWGPYVARYFLVTPSGVTVTPPN